MKRVIKNLFSVILAVMLVIGMFPAGPAKVNASNTVVSFFPRYEGVFPAYEGQSHNVITITGSAESKYSEFKLYYNGYYDSQNKLTY